MPRALANQLDIVQKLVSDKAIISIIYVTLLYLQALFSIQTQRIDQIFFKFPMQPLSSEVLTALSLMLWCVGIFLLIWSNGRVFRQDYVYLSKVEGLIETALAIPP